MKEGSESCSMTAERVEKLESIGFTWTLRVLEDIWDERFEQLKEFKAEHGHFNVPKDHKPNKSLGAWVSTQLNDRSIDS